MRWLAWLALIVTLALPFAHADSLYLRANDPILGQIVLQNGYVLSDGFVSIYSDASSPFTVSGHQAGMLLVLIYARSAYSAGSLFYYDDASYRWNYVGIVPDVTYTFSNGMADQLRFQQRANYRVYLSSTQSVLGDFVQVTSHASNPLAFSYSGHAFDNYFAGYTPSSITNKVYYSTGDGYYALDGNSDSPNGVNYFVPSPSPTPTPTPSPVPIFDIDSWVEFEYPVGSGRWVSGVRIPVGESFKVRAMARNVGLNQLPYNSEVGFKRPGDLSYTRFLVARLNPGQQYVFVDNEVTACLQAGRKNYESFADINGVIQEGNEENNHFLAYVDCSTGGGSPMLSPALKVKNVVAQPKGGIGQTGWLNVVSDFGPWVAGAITLVAIIYLASRNHARKAAHSGRARRKK